MPLVPSCSIVCPLCGSRTGPEEVYGRKAYRKCDVCGSVSMDRVHHLTAEAERARYERHSVDTSDPGYRRFVSPLIDAVRRIAHPGDRVLDFGSGRSAIVSEMLKEGGFVPDRYDPFFWPDEKVLERRYDAIVCCEVVEHFREPRREFGMLRGMLDEGGHLVIMTHVMDKEMDFSTWYYKDDETHVFFYSHESFEWIRSNLGFRDLSVDGRVVVIGS